MRRPAGPAIDDTFAGGLQAVLFVIYAPEAAVFFSSSEGCCTIRLNGTS